MTWSRSKPAESVAFILRIISDNYGSNNLHEDQNSVEEINLSGTEVAVKRWNSGSVASKRMTL